MYSRIVIRTRLTISAVPDKSLHMLRYMGWDVPASKRSGPITVKMTLPTVRVPRQVSKEYSVMDGDMNSSKRLLWNRKRHADHSWPSV